ncbi:hypothetical protein BSN85_16385 [Bradyrhizobium brasilense]|uniref:hypothetical protein n=1 Tax=Bradyrhizobium brasilense TaxID=1419277 RepID=UPI0009756ABC|nr:hypothetical protein [Bradyrhizobium brasilense]OMI09504.1 hypothetical protein BSN85_16385 [Bradyrhizobium brasilense]
MANFLDLACPHCDATDKIEIASTLWLRVTETGTEPDFNGCYEYTPHSSAVCTNCGHAGTVRSFEQAGDKK